jgi:hypothetical protein
VSDIGQKEFVMIMDVIKIWRGKLINMPVGENKAHIVNVLRVLMLVHQAQTQYGKRVVYKNYPRVNIILVPKDRGIS